MKEDIQSIAKKHIQNNDYLGWFEEVYQKGKNEDLTIPWVSLDPNPFVKDGCEKIGLKGEGKRALVIGCGLGEDAEYLSQLGFTVDAFDFSPTAIEWCKEIHKESKANYFLSDLLALPESVKNYDFIVEIYTLQTMPEELRAKAIKILPTLLAQNGLMLLICRGREEGESYEGVPFPLTQSELKPLSDALSVISFQFLLHPDDDWKRYRFLYQKT